MRCFLTPPHPHHTHNTHQKTHPLDPDIPNTVCHTVITFIIFLWYKTIFSTDLHCVRLYINKEK